MNRSLLSWLALAVALAVPVIAALFSPLLQWREPVYIVAGLCGIIALAVLLLQPILARAYLPGLSAPRSRHLHQWIGRLLLLMVIGHVAGLWITSPPDVIDALLFVSATPFSVWGVIAMWGVFATACLVALKKRLQPGTWRLIHKTLVSVIVAASIAHALMIEGTMEYWSKILLCVLAAAATITAVLNISLTRLMSSMGFNHRQ